MPSSVQLKLAANKQGLLAYSVTVAGTGSLVKLQFRIYWGGGGGGWIKCKIKLSLASAGASGC